VSREERGRPEVRYKSGGKAILSPLQFVLKALGTVSILRCCAWLLISKSHSTHGRLSNLTRNALPHPWPARFGVLGLCSRHCSRVEQLNPNLLRLVGWWFHRFQTESRSRFVVLSNSRHLLTSVGGIYWEPLRRDDKTGGIAIKMTRGPDGLLNGAPQQVFSYNLEGEQVWYDLSSVFGAPFAGRRLEVTSDTGRPIVWPAGTHPGGSQVQVAPSRENIWFTVYDDEE
jgi:hypothetical protein